MKKISVLALVLALAISLTGCSSDEIKLYNAFNKMQDVTSVESDVEMGFVFEAEGFSEEEQLELQRVAAMVNTSKFKMHTKQKQNKDKTVVQSQIDTNINFGGMGMDFNVWVDMDASNNKFKMVEIIKMPQMLMNLMFSNEPTKQYIVYDIGQIVNAQNEEINFKELMEFAKDFQPKLTEFIEKVQKDFNPGFEIVKQKDKKEINGKKLDIYELKINDAALKELVKYSVNYTIDNDTVIKFFKEYMDAIVDVGIVSEAEKEAAKAEIKEEFELLEKQLPEFKVKFNEFMEKHKDIQILGDKGIVVEYGIDKDGYVVHEVGNIDFKIDLAKISKAMGEEDESIKGIIKLGINFSSKTYNINSKDVKIEMPKVDENNSINVMQMMEEQMNQLQILPAPERAPLS